MTNLHTHTLFCDGYDTPEKYIESAVAAGMSSLGFSAHAPMPFYCKWALPSESLKKYYHTIQELKVKYSGIIEIYCGLELDFIPAIWDYTLDIRNAEKWDYIIGSIHFVDQYPNGTHWTIDGDNLAFKKGFNEIFNGNSERAITRYFECTRQMVTQMKPQIIGHMDKIKIQYREDCLMPDSHPFFRQEIIKTLDVIVQSKCIVEINTRGMYRRNETDFYPGKWTMEQMFLRNIPVTISTDAHRAEEVPANWDTAAQFLKDAGYSVIKGLKMGKWVDFEI
jgi:histidinol-phosphatase (PHP family)